MALTRKGCDDAQCAVYAQQDQERRQPEAVAEVAGVAAGVETAAAVAAAPWWADRIRTNKHVECDTVAKLKL